MKTVAIAAARMGSSRAPGKVMRDLGGIPVLQWTINALRGATGIDEIILATSKLPADDVIEEYCACHEIQCFRGDEADVLDRYYQCAKSHNADVVIRVTCDCPFLDSRVISEVIKLRELMNADYASNIDPPSYADGLDVECFTFAALEAAWKETVSPVDRDCVPQFIVRNRHRFKSANLTCPLPGQAKERWVLDTWEDYEFCKVVEKHLGYFHPTYTEILAILDAHPEIRKINPGIRNERFYEGLANEQLPPRTFERSKRIYERVIQIIPFGAQTFSKSHIQYPAGKSPLFLSHGDGAYVFDVDGNRYVDLVNAILPVVLGYRDPDVDEAIRRQLDNGISFSLATELEYELASRLIKHIPCAEMVKFGKSGTDVTTAAIRLARGYTGRDHILLAGYHGWADWSMACTDRDLGIPEAVKAKSHRITFGEYDNGWLKNKPFLDKTAAIIVEPNDDPDYLAHLRTICNEHGIVLIFDEIITGFRYDIGGAQKLFGVTPDLACFGKAMANGMPISAIVGKRDIMQRMSPPNNIFYSGTFFGETLSIAAAIATIDKIEKEDVISHLTDTGTKLEFEILKLINSNEISDAVSIEGWYPRQILKFRDARGATADQIRTLFMQEMIQGGVLIINSNNISFSHRGPEMKRIVSAYSKAFASIGDRLRKGDIASYVDSPVSAAPLRSIA